MRFESLDPCRVIIDLRSAGLLGIVGHDPRLTARAEPFAVTVGEGPVDTAVDVVFRADAIEPSGDIPESDRRQMSDNLRGPEVLDAARFGTVELRGRYVGTLTGGVLSGDLRVRGAARPLRMEVHVALEGEAIVATGEWVGRLTDLGIKPFTALLGALKLKDWIRLRLEARFSRAAQ
jgi:hypothetical protein